MLQYNAAPEGDVAAAPAGRRAHVAHALVVALHMICCGLPAAIALFGATLGLLAIGGVVTRVHVWMHGYEGAFLLLSAALVALGGAAEWSMRRAQRGFPVLFAVSVACLLVNTAIVVSHQAPPKSARVTQLH